MQCDKCAINVQSYTATGSYSEQFLVRGNDAKRIVFKFAQSPRQTRPLGVFQQSSVFELYFKTKQTIQQVSTHHSVLMHHHTEHACLSVPVVVRVLSLCASYSHLVVSFQYETANKKQTALKTTVLLVFAVVYCYTTTHRRRGKVTK